MTTKAIPAGPVTWAAPAQPVQEEPADLVEVWGIDSFPASDPPANW